MDEQTTLTLESLSQLKIWWTLARDTNSDNIVEVILPAVSIAEGLIFVEEVYSSIHSLKALNPNALTIIILNI